MPSLPALQRELAGRAVLVAVYIAEAHATDEWPISSCRYNGGRGPVCVAAPRDDGERLALARAFTDDFSFSLPMLVDAVSQGDAFEKAYAPWPLRFYGIDGGGAPDAFELGFVAHPWQCSYDLGAARDWALRAAEAREAAGA